MTICNNCGVVLDDGMNKCPLCGRDPAEETEKEIIPDNSPSSIMELQRKETRRYLWELSGIIAFSGIAVCTIVDLLITGSLRWSLYSDISISAAWIILSLIMYLHRRPLVLSALTMLTVLAALFFADMVSGARSWFFALGLPVTLAAFVAAAAIIALYRAADFRGLNIIAAGLLILSGFCIITEMSLDKFAEGYVDLRWSLIAGVSILPVSLIFFFYHYRLKKGNRLDSFFHI